MKTHRRLRLALNHEDVELLKRITRSYSESITNLVDGLVKESNYMLPYLDDVGALLAEVVELRAKNKELQEKLDEYEKAQNNIEAG